MSLSTTAKTSLAVAVPVMLGYVSIGIPCGIMESKIGYTPLMSLLVSATFYSGAGQFMISNMWMAGAPLASVIASVAFVNTRQMLYSAAFAPYFSAVPKRLTLLFSATVTDESFGVNLGRFATDESWSAANAAMANLLCMASWSVSDFVGCLVGGALTIPTAMASFAMTSIFICLLVGQRASRTNVVVMIVSASCVLLLKCVGLAGPAILFGAAAGVVAGLLVRWARGR